MSTVSFNITSSWEWLSILITNLRDYAGCVSHRAGILDATLEFCLPQVGHLGLPSVDTIIFLSMRWPLLRSRIETGAGNCLCASYTKMTDLFFKGKAIFIRFLGYELEKYLKHHKIFENHQAILKQTNKWKSSSQGHQGCLWTKEIGKRKQTKNWPLRLQKQKPRVNKAVSWRWGLLVAVWKSLTCTETWAVEKNQTHKHTPLSGLTPYFDVVSAVSFYSHSFLISLCPTSGQVDKKAWLLSPLVPVNDASHGSPWLHMRSQPHPNHSKHPGHSPSRALASHFGTLREACPALPKDLTYVSDKPSIASWYVCSVISLDRFWEQIALLLQNDHNTYLYTWNLFG